MKIFTGIIVAVLFFSILLIPSEDAPMSVFFGYMIWSSCALWIIHLIFKYWNDDKEKE